MTYSTTGSMIGSMLLVFALPGASKWVAVNMGGTHRNHRLTNASRHRDMNEFAIPTCTSITRTRHKVQSCPSKVPTTKKGSRMSDLSGLRQILSPQFLSETYSKVASLTSYNPMLDFFHRPTEYDGDEIEVVRLDSVSEPAPMNLRGQAARTLDAQGLETVRFTPIHAFNEVTIPMSAIEYLRQTDSPRVQERGIQELRRQMEAFGRRHRALRAVVLAKALTTGVIYWDPQSGSVMETPTDIKIDLGVSDEHKGLLDHSAFGAEIISAAWDQPDTKILSQLDSNARGGGVRQGSTATPHLAAHVGQEWFRNNNQVKVTCRPTRSSISNCSSRWAIRW